MTIMTRRLQNARWPLLAAAIALVLYVAGELLAPAGLAPDHLVGAGAQAMGRFAVHCGLVMAN